MAEETNGGGPVGATIARTVAASAPPAIGLAALKPVFDKGIPQVETCFALGWHVAELYALPDRGDPPDDPQAEHILPLYRGLPADGRLTMLTNQVATDAQTIAKGLPPPAMPGFATLPSLLTDWKQAADPDARRRCLDAYRAAVKATDAALMADLLVRNFRFGKAYGLGRALCSITTQRGWEAAARLLGDETLAATVQGWLGDLKSSFATCATDTVVITFQQWRKVAAQTAGPQALSNLDRQGEIWRSLLSGEKACTDFLNMGDYVLASLNLVGQYARLAGSFLRRWWLGIGLALVVLVALGGLALAMNQAGGVFGAVAAALGLLGLTGASAGAAVRQALGLVEQPLWQIEITDAMVFATSCVGDDLEPQAKRDILEERWRRPKDRRLR